MTMARVKKISMLVTIPLVTILQGCYPDKIDYVDEYDLAATSYDEEADFSLYMTFTVVDTIMHLTDDGEDDPNLSREHDAYILDLIRENMSNYGYVEVADADSLNPADLTLFVEALSSDYYQYWGYYYNYWGWYGGWYGGYYPGYPWYPSYPWYPPGYVTSYTTGTLMINMFDSYSFNPESNTIDGLWMGAADGILSGNSSHTRERIGKLINQLFIQSQYLKK